MLKLSLALRSVQRLNTPALVNFTAKYHGSYDSAPVIQTTSDVNSEQYQENYTQMKGLVNQLSTVTKNVLSGLD